MQKVMFSLSMPGVASWNGRWTGEGRKYFIIKSLPLSQIEKLGLNGKTNSWYHRWSDGWAAEVTARVLNKGERPGKSDGFSGYDWMVENILGYGETKEPGKNY